MRTAVGILFRPDVAPARSLSRAPTVIALDASARRQPSQANLLPARAVVAGLNLG